MEIKLAIKMIFERYKYVLENQNDLICVYDKNYKILFINTAYAKYFNLDRDAAIGTSFLTLVPKSEHLSIKKSHESLTQQKPENTIEHLVLCPSGKVRWHRWKDIAVFDDKGVLTEYQSLGVDITEIKELQERLEKLEKTQEENGSIYAHAVISGAEGHSKTIVKLCDVIYIESDGRNTKAKLACGWVKIKKSIGMLESELSSHGFLGVHRRFIINLGKVAKLESIEDSKYKIYFADTQEVVSSSKSGAKRLRDSAFAASHTGST
jgi:PAS domain S-box-containing protein